MNAGVEAAVSSSPLPPRRWRTWPPSEPLNPPPLCEIPVSNLGGRLQSDQTSMPASVPSARTRVGVFAQTTVCGVVSRCLRTRGGMKASLSVSAENLVLLSAFLIFFFCCIFTFFFPASLLFGFFSFVVQFSAHKNRQQKHIMGNDVASQSLSGSGFGIELNPSPSMMRCRTWSNLIIQLKMYYPQIVFVALLRSCHAAV